MKKSELYHMAQIAVLNSQCIAPENKLEILRILIEDENVSKFCEEQDAKDSAVLEE